MCLLEVLDLSFFRPVKISSYGLTVHNVQNFNMSAWRSERLCQAVTREDGEERKEVLDLSSLARP